MSNEDAPLGVLLVNLGTPDAPSAAAIRRYLAEFLTDRRVVNLPRAVWLPILYGFILPFRPSRLIPKYRYIWGDEGAPIRACTQALAGAVEARLAQQQISRRIRVSAAMTYGKPAIAEAIAHLADDGISDLLVVPLFPQYSAATTAAVFDKLASVVAHSPLFGDLRFIDEYFESPAYIQALAQSLEPYAGEFDDGVPLLFSFHGIPISQVEAGDPYPDRCRATAQLVADRLGLREDQWRTSFQSRFGPAPWVQPYTDETLTTLARSGAGRVIVICPGFATDCLETLHEIAVEGSETFIAAGGRELTYVPALNASDHQVDIITSLVLSHLYPGEFAR